MYMVYWTTIAEAGHHAHAQAFDSTSMVAAMTFMEQLRARQRDGEALGFIALASEHPDSVGLAGVADAGPDYQWKKRRP